MAGLTLQPGACVAQIARENGINDNLFFNWRNLHRQGLLDPASRATLIPVHVEPLSLPAVHWSSEASDGALRAGAGGGRRERGLLHGGGVPADAGDGNSAGAGLSQAAPGSE